MDMNGSDHPSENSQGRKDGVKTSTSEEFCRLHAVEIRRIRVKKEHSAFVYCIFESLEGACSYSTLQHQPGDPFRDLVLVIPVSFIEQMNEIQRELGDLIYELNRNTQS